MRIVAPIMVMSLLAIGATLVGSVLIVGTHKEVVESTIRNEMKRGMSESTILRTCPLSGDPTFYTELVLPSSGVQWAFGLIHCHQEDTAHETESVIRAAWEQEKDWRAEWTEDAAYVIGKEIEDAPCPLDMPDISSITRESQRPIGVLRGPKGYEFLLSWVCDRGGQTRLLSMVPYSYVHVEVSRVVYVLVTINVVLFSVAVLYSFYFNHYQRMTAHALRNRIATLGNKVHNLLGQNLEVPPAVIDSSSFAAATIEELLDLQRYCEFVDGWVGLFLDKGLGLDEDDEAMADAVINVAMVEGTFEIMGGAMDKRFWCYGDSVGQRVSVPRIYVVLMLEILLDNARKYAAGKIAVRILDEASTVVVVVEDDGNGIGWWKRAQISSRMTFRHGIRTLRLLAKRAGASFRFSKSTIGGAAVHVRLPKA